MEAEKPRPAALAATLLPAGLIVAAVLWLLVAGQGAVRPSADSVETVPIWHQWLPPLVGIGLLLLTPSAPVPCPQPPPGRERLHRSRSVEAGGLVVLAVLFTVVLLAGAVVEPAYTVVKLVLLVGTPLLLLRRWRFRPVIPPTRSPRAGAWPLLPILGWGLVAYATPLFTPATDAYGSYDPLFLLAALVVGFLGNAVIEEFFYRRWLQSRLELLIGRAGGILWATVLWSVWHAAIQPVGRLDLDLAAALANHAMLGIFLGLLWSRYRRMWPLLVVHGAVNADELVLALLR